ncbi:MAG: MBL fold metallo-hydrolase, partial [Gallionellales bacterium CG_4_9_14_0_8_um_filter_59_50]
MTKLLGLLFLLPALACAVPFNIENIAPGVYVHRGEHKDLSGHYGGDICNTSFIVGSKGVAVIDTGGSPAVGAQLRKAIRKVTRLPILYVITTHVHPDHALGSAAFKQDKPVFVGHDKLANEMALRKEVYLRNQAEWVGKDAKGSE